MDEQAKIDGSGRSGQLGISETTHELRRMKLTDKGHLLSANVAGGTFGFYQSSDSVALTTGFVETSFGYSVMSLLIINDNPATGALEYSFDGTNIHNKLNRGEYKTISGPRDSIWVRGQSVAGISYRTIGE